MTAILSLGNENSCCQPRRQIVAAGEQEGATMADGELRWYGVRQRQRRRRRRWDQEKRRRSIERGCCARSGMKNPAKQTYCGLRNSSSSSSSSFKARASKFAPLSVIMASCERDRKLDTIKIHIISYIKLDDSQ